MSLAFIKDINPSVSYALWRIDEPLELMESLYAFSEADRELFKAHKIERRRAEWLAARLALKALMNAKGLPQQDIIKDEFGKPHVAQAQIEISISHTKNYGAAALSHTGAVGIDIEYPRDQIQRIARKFLHANEANWAQNDQQRLTKVWCAKEALYKLHGRTQLIFAEQLRLSHEGGVLTRGKICENGQEEEHPLHYDQIDQMHLCLAY